MTDPKDPKASKPRFLRSGSPLVFGGKARLMSPRKVEPNRAKPREISGDEVYGYRNNPKRQVAQHEPDPPGVVDAIREARSLLDEPECLDGADWKRYIGKPTEQSETAEQMARQRELVLLSQEERIIKAQQKAKERRRNVSGEVWLLRQMQAKGRPPDLIEKRVQVLERMVYLGSKAA